MQAQDEHSEGPDRGVEPLSVEPGAVSDAARRGQGNVEVPIGVPVSEEEWRELKRRADEPGPTEEAESDTSADDSANN